MFKPKVLPLKKGQHLIVCPNGDIFIDDGENVKEARRYSDRGGLRVNVNGKLMHLGRFIAEQFLPNPFKSLGMLSEVSPNITFDNKTSKESKPATSISHSKYLSHLFTFLLTHVNLNLFELLLKQDTLSVHI